MKKYEKKQIKAALKLLRDEVDGMASVYGGFRYAAFDVDYIDARGWRRLLRIARRVAREFRRAPNGVFMRPAKLRAEWREFLKAEIEREVDKGVMSFVDGQNHD